MNILPLNENKKKTKSSLPKDELKVLSFLAEHGARFSRVNPKGKAPVTETGIPMRGWDKSKLTLDEIIPWRKSGGSVGVVCDVLAFLDVDDNFNSFLETFPELKKAPMVWRDNAQSGKVLIQIAGKVPHKKKYTGKTHSLERLSLGGHAVVMGTHESGVPYKFTLGALPELTSRQIDEIGVKWAGSKVEQEYPTLDKVVFGNRNDGGFHNALCLFRQGMDLQTATIAIRTSYNARGMRDFPNEDIERAVKSAWGYFSKERPEGKEIKEWVVRDMDYVMNVELPPIKWFVQNWMAEGTVNVLYGQKASCKTYSMLHLLTHIAAGVPWLGKNVIQGNCLYIDEEMGNHRMHDRFREVAIGAGLGDKNPVAYISKVGFNLDRGPDGDRCMTDLRRLIEQRHLAFLTIDNLSRVMAGDENLKKDVQPTMDRLSRLVEDTGAAIVLQHHLGKDIKGDARGSSAIGGSADTMTCIAKAPKTDHSKLVTFDITKGRDFDEYKFSALCTWGPDTNTFTMEPTDENVESAHKPYKHEADILAYMSTSACAQSSAVAKALGLNPETIRKAMDRLVGTSLVRTEGGSHQAAIYKLMQTASAE